MSQSLINQGNILTPSKGFKTLLFDQQVAIPYKSGKYSYKLNNLINAALPQRRERSQSLINQGNILTKKKKNIPTGINEKSQSLINQGNILTDAMERRVIMTIVRSQSLINQGNILTVTMNEQNCYTPVGRNPL